jgi:hypothetical protein
MLQLRFAQNDKAMETGNRSPRIKDVSWGRAEDCPPHQGACVWLAAQAKSAVPQIWKGLFIFLNLLTSFL